VELLMWMDLNESVEALEVKDDFDLLFMYDNP